jgi:hypothetical protein
MLLRQNLINLGLNEPQIDLIIGTLLGDGNLQTYTNGSSWRYRALHVQEHKEYLQHKFNVLQNMIRQNNISYSEVYDQRTKNIYYRYYFNTKVHYCLKIIADYFYNYDTNTKKYVKIVPTNIKDLLTPQALVYFYQDDGALKGRSNVMRLCTENFSLNEVILIQKALFELYGIHTSMHKKPLSGETSSYQSELTRDHKIIGYRIFIP